VFLGDVGGIIGNLKMAFPPRAVTPDAVCRDQQHSPPRFSSAYQMMFGHHHPGLIIRGFHQQSPVWGLHGLPDRLLLFVYFPAVHMVWGRRLAPEVGRLDFAGGIVVHAIAGWPPWRPSFSSVTARSGKKRSAQHSLVALGTGLLWFGWYG